MFSTIFESTEIVISLYGCLLVDPLQLLLQLMKLAALALAAAFLVSRADFRRCCVEVREDFVGGNPISPSMTVTEPVKVTGELYRNRCELI